MIDEKKLNGFDFSRFEELVWELEKRYPFVGRRVIGRSVMGKPIYCLIVGRGERQALINSAHHANEWITCPILVEFLYEYCAKISSGGTIYGYPAEELFDKTTLYAVPLVDPDGMELVTGAIDREGGYYQRALEIAGDFPAIPFPEGWKANIEGIDINLCYPAGWERAREIKAAMGFDRPAPRDFPGYEPLSAPESRAMYDFTLKRDILISASCHTQGMEIYWSFEGIEPPRGREIGEMLAQVSGWALSEPDISSSYAGYKDWFIQNYIRPGYTFEIGRGVNPLPISEFPGLYAQSAPAFAVLLGEALKI